MRRKKLFLMSLLLIFCAFLAPNIVRAAPASASNWQLFCDSKDLTATETTNCYLIAQITDGDKPISAVLTNVQTNQYLEVVNAAGAFTYINVEKTLASAPFSNTLHGSKTNCDSEGNCYDFTSSDGIKSNPTNSTIINKGYTGYTPIGYWTVKLIPEAITNDVDCGRICMSVNYIVDNNTAGGNVVGENNGSCIEIHLKAEVPNVCYCNSSSNICYGANGTEVSREQYEQECKKICKYEDGKYYDDTGAEVSEDVYVAKCAKKCYQSNGKYYGKDGKEITKEQYEKDCVPKTGSFASYAVLAAGALIALSAITIAKKHNRFYRV